MKKKKKPAKGKSSAAKGQAKKVKSKTLKPIKKKKAVKKVSAKKKAKKKSSDIDLECFLTTACIKHYHLPDDAYELNTLRHYRDNYLRSFDEGRKLVDDYYRLAPEIVKQIEKDKEKTKIYKFIYTQITKACEKIESDALSLAKFIYVDLVKNLQMRYKVQHE